MPLLVYLLMVGSLFDLVILAVDTYGCGVNVDDSESKLFFVG